VQEGAREAAGRSFSNRSENQFLHASASRACARLLRRTAVFPLDRKQILDVGCGEGHWLLEMLKWGATVSRVHGIDLRAERITQARARLAGAELLLGDAGELPWADGVFDLVTQFSVFGSLPEAETRSKLAQEMLRVLKPDGRILWYDTGRSLLIRPRGGLGRKEIRALFPKCTFEFLDATLAPELARRVAPRSWAGAFALEGLPFTKTGLAAVIRRA